MLKPERDSLARKIVRVYVEAFAKPNVREFNFKPETMEKIISNQVSIYAKQYDLVKYEKEMITYALDWYDKTLKTDFDNLIRATNLLTPIANYQSIQWIK